MPFLPMCQPLTLALPQVPDVLLCVPAGRRGLLEEARQRLPLTEARAPPPCLLPREGSRVPTGAARRSWSEPCTQLCSRGGSGCTGAAPDISLSLCSEQARPMSNGKRKPHTAPARCQAVWAHHPWQFVWRGTRESVHGPILVSADFFMGGVVGAKGQICPLSRRASRSGSPSSSVSTTTSVVKSQIPGKASST